MELRWLQGTIDLRCPVCSRDREQELVATVPTVWSESPVPIARCAGCSAVILGAVQPPAHYDERDVDQYIEHYASVEAIAGVLARAGASPDARMLDVGCGYGLGVDIGASVFGWQGIGVDPSRSAARGRAELGIDIRAGLLDDAFAPDERFDVIVAGEMLEHVPDPRGFLAALRDRLTDTGVTVLTTPDASVVQPSTPMPALYAALSIGAHEFLVDEGGLGRLLAGAGLVFAVRRDGATLHAVAARSAEALARAAPDAVVDPMLLVRYCDMRADTAPPGSALALGMSARHTKLCVNLGEYDLAARGLPRLERALRDRYGVSLDDPVGDAELRELRSVFVVARYFAGMVALVRDRDSRRAVRCFEAAAEVSRERYLAQGEIYSDPETPVLEGHALRHRAIALARVDAAAVAAALHDLERAVARGAGEPGIVDMARAEVASEVARRSFVGRSKRIVRGGARRLRAATRGRRSSGPRA